jgi:hypothetical protein
LSALGDTATSLVLILLQDTDLLECLHDLAVDTSGSVHVVRWTRAAVTSGSVDLSQASDTDGFSQVDMSSDGSSTDVEPVDRLGREFLCWPGLDGVNPTYTGQHPQSKLEEEAQVHTRNRKLSLSL